jgi:hypothetical protein
MALPEYRPLVSTSSMPNPVSIPNPVGCVPDQRNPLCPPGALATVGEMARVCNSELWIGDVNAAVQGGHGIALGG